MALGLLCTAQPAGPCEVPLDEHGLADQRHRGGEAKPASVERRPGPVGQDLTQAMHDLAQIGPAESSSLPSNRTVIRSSRFASGTGRLAR